MVDTAEVRRRLRRVIEQSKRAAHDRRARVEAATRDGERTLREVVAPMFRTMAGVLKAEGYLFVVSTPKGAAQLAAEGHGENLIELALDTSSDPPALRSRVSRARGRRILVDEQVLREGDAIGSMTAEDTLDFLLAALPPFLERS